MEPSFLKEDNSSGHFDFNEKSSDDDYSSDFNKVTISLTFYLAFCGEHFRAKHLLEEAQNIDIDPTVSRVSLNKKSDRKVDSSSSMGHASELTGFCTSCEYSLAPFNTEPTKMELQVDCENTKIQVPGKDAKTITNWCENSMIWVSWTNNHTVRTTNDTFQYLNRKICINLTKDSNKTISKLKEKSKSNASQASNGNVKQQIEGLYETVRKVYGKNGMEEIEEQRHLRKMVACAMETQNAIDKLKCRVLNDSLNSIKREVHEDEDKAATKKGKIKSDEKKISRKEKSKHENEKIIPEVEEKYEIYVAKINLAKFTMSLKNQVLLREFLPQSQVDTSWIEEAFVKVEIINGCLLTHEQLCSLNPMLISTKSAKNLPSLPLNFQEIGMICEPSYISHCFLNEEQFRHRSNSLPQFKRVVWDDNYVVFLGEIEPSILKEFFFGPGLEIEVHDRDLRRTNKASLFGTADDDVLYNCMSYVSYKNFLKKTQSWHSNHVSAYHGKALLNLSDILKGQTSIKSALSITNSSIPYEAKDHAGLFGNYITSASVLNVQITLHHPFVPRNILESRTRFYESVQSPFSRIIIKFDHANKCFLKALVEMVTKLNSSALNLEHLTFMDQQIILSTYKLSQESSCSPCLDVITGFHVCDKSCHVVILEGLACGLLINSVYHLIQSLASISELNGELRNSLELSTDNLAENHKWDLKEIKIMHHSNMTFQKRLYSGFNLNFQTIQLEEAISDILSQPLIHTRSLIPYSCYSALTKIYKIQQASTLTFVARNDAFPIFEEMLVLSKEFSTGMCSKHLELLKEQIQVQKETSLEVNI